MGIFFCIKYLHADQDLLPTLQYVLDAIDETTHVSPVIFRDMELSYISDEQVGGIEDFKTGSSMVLGDRPVQTLLHEEVFKMSAESSELFKTLVIKTNCALPYTSFFIRLDCEYWNSDQENDLRSRMNHADTSIK